MNKILPVIIIILLLIVIKNNLSNIFNFISHGSGLGSLEQTLIVEEKKNKYLKERLKYVKTDDFIEEEAKSLGMLREGEFIVIAPTASPLGADNLQIDTEPNWRRWLQLFF